MPADPFREKLKAYETLVGGSFWVILNMNDTFGYATAEGGGFNSEDFELAAPVLARYGDDALTAYVSFSRGVQPIAQRRTEAFKAALKEFATIKAEHPNFCTEIPDAYR